MGCRVGCVCVVLPPKVAEELDGKHGVYCHKDEHDCEGIQHAWDRFEQRHEDLVERPYALEEPKHAECAQDLDLRKRAQIYLCEGDRTHNNDHQV